MKVTVIAEKQPGVRNCSCFLEKDVDEKHGLSGYGPTVDAAVKDLLDARQEYIDIDGVDMPELEWHSNMTFGHSSINFPSMRAW